MYDVPIVVQFVREVKARVLGRGLKLIDESDQEWEVNQLLFADHTRLVPNREEKLCRLVTQFVRVCERIYCIPKRPMSFGLIAQMKDPRLKGGINSKIIASGQPGNRTLVRKTRTTVTYHIAICLTETSCIRISKVQVPKYLEVGSSGDLKCTWQEENDQMYSIKWYQAAHEFYRYTPTGKETIQIFDTPTLDVDRQNSHGGNVRIANVTLDAAGPFHCEVSAEGPTFHTASEQDTLNIIDFPDGGPKLQGIKAQYLPGEQVDITCITRRSKPAPELSITVNNEQIAARWADPQINSEDHEGLATASLRVRFPLTPRLIERNGYATVRCKAEIAAFYEDTVDEIISTRAPYHASVLDGGAAAGRRPGIPSTCVMVLGTLLISSLYRQVF
ncbi:uncharacterized protein [Palaemon carinicauda]|uniref:uncharacterized protein n=1 Tax=Palaemon carinicauda TaxID=392227 RepID=UPI0035B69DB6